MAEYLKGDIINEFVVRMLEKMVNKEPIRALDMMSSDAAPSAMRDRPEMRGSQQDAINARTGSFVNNPNPPTDTAQGLLQNVQPMGWDFMIRLLQQLGAGKRY